MKISLSWLKDYIPIDIDVYELADKLTMAGLEVESVLNRYEYLDTVLVGSVVNVKPHPNADKLKLCDVNLGNRLISVVCGAPNVKEGMLSPVALPGTLFPNGLVLEKGVIRGETSEGMLCSEAELGLGADKSGIMVLEPNLTVGDKLAKALSLSDFILDVSITPNRADCLSIIGIAREVAALYKTEVRYPDVKISDPNQEISQYTSVSIEAPDHCPRYAARFLEDIKIAPSPFWLQDRLMSVGLRPINNIVDITNFVLMEMGQPLHAFDFDHLAQNRIVVRTANEGEKFTTLDQKERLLSSDMLMICDGEKPVAVAGVMGGLNSEIEDTTTQVLIESAYFNPVSIRKTSKKLGLNTEASYRFERGVDPDGTLRAANRAALLMAELGGGKIIHGLIDEYPKKISPTKISLSVNAANRLLSIKLKRDDMADILTSIEFAVEKHDDTLEVIPPSFRADVTRPEDLMEEIARLWGYDKIPTTFAMFPPEAKITIKPRRLREQLREMMVGFGFTEAVNYSFIHKDSCNRLSLPENDVRRNQIGILNPLSEDQAVMRTSLIPGLLETLRRNLFQQVRTLKLFETGKIFIANAGEDLPTETEMLAGLWTGSRFNPSWHSDRKESDCDFYDIKGVVEGIFAGLQIHQVKFTRMPYEFCYYTRPGHTARILLSDDGKEVGLIGELHPDTLANFDLKQKAFIFEIDMNALMPYVPDVKQAEPLPKYPAVFRDITLIIPKDIETGNVLKSIKDTGEELVEDISLFDLYEGGSIPAGNKSISFRITYRSYQETLEDTVVNRIHTNIAEMLLTKFDATLPSL